MPLCRVSFSNTDFHTFSYSNSKPGMFIDFWLTKAPMVFLVIAALAFIVGLNLFPYSSSQVCFFSFSYTALINDVTKTQTSISTFRQRQMCSVCFISLAYLWLFRGTW